VWVLVVIPYWVNFFILSLFNCIWIRVINQLGHKIGQAVFLPGFIYIHIRIFFKLPQYFFLRSWIMDNQSGSITIS
jgi:hypothetical protein